MYTNTPWVEIISGRVIQSDLKSITVQRWDCDLVHIEVSEKMYHMIRWVQQWASVIVHHTASGPKSIATYL